MPRPALYISFQPIIHFKLFTIHYSLFTIFWFRRDLRLEDNAGLYHALKSGQPVLPLFIFDTEILDKLEKNDARLGFIYDTLCGLKQELAKFGSTILVKHGKPEDIFQDLMEDYKIKAVYTNEDYEFYARERDYKIENLLKEKGVCFYSFKDQVIFAKDEILKADGSPYTVFTPFSNKWKSTLNDFYLKAYPTEKYFHNLIQTAELNIPTLEFLGFERNKNIVIPPHEIPESIISDYEKTRNLPALEGTSRLGLHLRFGTISIMRLAARAKELNETFLNELIWREFFIMILWHFPQVEKNAFRPAYDRIIWRNNESEFNTWCEGKTGFPLIDAGMRELKATGFMHNRVRMLVASFLVKNLLIDWRWGEAWFANHLLDYELAANNGNWQWAAGTGCDAAPYFRIFNPETQARKFDPEGKYIRRWVPEYGTPAYPKQMVDLSATRLRALEAYKAALKGE